MNYPRRNDFYLVARIHAEWLHQFAAIGADAFLLRKLVFHDLQRQLDQIRFPLAFLLLAGVTDFLCFGSAITGAAGFAVSKKQAVRRRAFHLTLRTALFERA